MSNDKSNYKKRTLKGILDHILVFGWASFVMISMVYVTMEMTK